MITRRKAIEQTVAVASLAAWSPFAPLFAAPAAGPRRFNIGACQWSLGRSDATCFDVAKQIGLDGVQVDMGNAANEMQLRRPEVRQRYLDASRRTKLQIASLAMAELNNIPLKSDPRAKQWLADSIAVMAALNVPLVLVAQFHKGDLKGDAPGIERTIEILRDIAPRAQAAGVVLGIENYLSAEENLHILREVKSPAVKVYYDVGNSTDKGYDIYKEIRLLKGQICEFHAKDGGHMLGQGRIDFAKVRAAIDDIGYRGWIQIEAAAPHGLVADYTAHLGVLRRHFHA